MQAYNARAENYNPHVPPPVPALVWDFERRKAMSLQRREGKDRNPGSARRWRREYSTRDLLTFLGNAQLAEGTWTNTAPRLRVRPKSGEPARASRDRPLPSFTYSLYAVLREEIPACPRWFTVMRANALGLIAQAEKHGPASGWGISQPRPEGKLPAKWTPFYVPKKSEKCHRWWRWLVLGLMRLMARMARALPSLVPLQRLPLGPTALGATAVESRRAQATRSTEVQGPAPESLASILARVEAAFGERPVAGSQEAPIER